MYVSDKSSESNGETARRAFSDPQAGWIGAVVARVVGVVARWPWVVLLLCVAITAGAGVYASGHLGINTDTADLLSEDIPFRRNFRAYRDAFPQFKNNLVIVITAPSPAAAEDAGERLYSRLKRRPELFGSLFYPPSDPYFRQNGLLYLSLAQLEDLSDRLTEAQPFLGTLAADPTLRGFLDVVGSGINALGSPDANTKQLEPVLERLTAVVEAAAVGRAQTLAWSELFYPEASRPEDRRTIITTQPKLDFSRLKPADEAIRTVRRLATDLGLTPENGIRVRLTGATAIDGEELESVATGAGTAGIISLALVTLLIFAGLRSKWLVLGVLVTLVAGLVLTAGFAALALGSLNLISVAFAVPFIGIAVDFGIHYALRFEEAAQGDEPARAALRSAARSVGRALVLSAAAAAVAFFAFLPTAYRGVAELGLLAGVGVVIALLLSITLLPAILALRPSWRPRVPSPTEDQVVSRLVHAEKWVKRRGKEITIVAVLAGFAAFAIAPASRFDRNPLNLKDPSTESVATAVELLDDEVLGGAAAQVLAPSLDAARKLAVKLNRLPDVWNVRTLASFVPSDQEEKLAIVGDLALLLKPALAAKPKTTRLEPAERVAAVGKFRAALRKALGDERAGKLRPMLERLDVALGKVLAGPDQARVLRRLERSLISNLPKRLVALNTALSAKRVAVKDLPDSLRERYVAASGVARIEVQPKENLRENGALRKFVKQVASVAPDATGAPVFELRAGDVVVDAYIEATLIALGVIVLLVFAVLRNVMLTVLVMTPVLLAGAFTLALCAIIDLPLNFANIIVLPLLVGLGAAGGIHIVKRADRSLGLVELLHTSTPRAVLFSALTTLASFGSLAVSSHRGTASMGELLFIAIFFTLVCSLVLLPAMMAFVMNSQPRGR